ncbi:MAG: DUF5667 domain-containing protein [Patescibacteria group bacterium]
MNNERFEKLIAILRSVSLSSEEKAEMFRNIKTAIAEDAFREELKPKAFSSFNFGFLRIFANRYAIAVVCLVVLVVSSAGISQAAEKSLPGDFLYPVKIQFNEKIKASFANTPVKKAKVESDLTIKRLEEAEALSAQGKLDAQKKESITKSLTKHSEEVTKNITKVRENVSHGAAVDLDDQLGLSLEEHTKVLDQLSEGTEDAKEPEEQKQSFENKHDGSQNDSKRVIKELKNRAEKSSHRKDDTNNRVKEGIVPSQ